MRKGAAVAGAALLDGACGRPLARVPASRAVVVYMGVNFPTDDVTVQAVGHFREGLREQGLVEGRDLSIEWLWAEGRGHAWVREQMANIADRRVDVVVAAGTLWRTVREMTETIPIVTLAGNAENLIAFGWATDLASPGKNITGLSFAPNQEYAKRVECLTRVVPTARR